MEVVPYAPEHRDQILSLLHDVPFKSLIWEWQFEKNPHASSFDPVVMVQDRRVIGFNGVMPARVKYGEYYLNALWSCDFYVDQDFRGQGVGKKIKENLLKQTPLTMSFGVSPSAAHVLEAMGWHSSADVYDYRLLRRPKNLRDRLLRGLQTGNRLTGVFDPAYSGSMSWSDALPDKGEVDAFWSSVEGRYDKICVRDFDYLFWKYCEHPLAEYDFLIARDGQGELEALLVVRACGKFVRIIDYVGPASNYALKKALVLETCRAFPLPERFNCTTSDAELGRALCHSGFFRARTRPSFFVRSSMKNDKACESGWFLMTGDSDGELLSAAGSAYARQGSKWKAAVDHTDRASRVVSGHGEPRLSVRRLSVRDFAALSEEWQSLLDRSHADRLFMSWPWLYSWWQVWGEKLGLELSLFGVYQDSERLVGLAPFYLHDFRSPVGLRVRRLHLLGNAWRIKGTVRTEYTGLIAEDGLEFSVTQLVFSEIGRLSWHEMVVCDQSLPELLRWQEVFDRSVINVRSVPRVVDSGVRVPVTGEFDQWLAELGRNTRLKAYNRRRYLAALGSLRLQEIDGSEAEYFLEQLNEFHRRRWGKPCFDEQAVAFHRKLISRLDEGQLALTALEYNGETVSVLYDIRAGQCRYNLQAGYLEDLDPKVALGTLHLGYAIEESFRDPRIAYYDLLAGYGKKSFYKTRFKGETVHFVTMQFARHPLMRGIYWFQSILPGRVRKPLNRLARL